MRFFAFRKSKMSELSLIPETLTMTSLEIAALTGKEHRNVMRDIRVMLVELHGEKDVLGFEHIFLDAYGREQPCFNLDHEHTMTLVTGYSVKLRHAVIKRWKELEAQVKTLQATPKAKRTYTKSVPFGQELRAVLDLALELRYSTFERNQAVIALLERPGYEALLATLPDRFKQPSPQDEIPDMALAGYANVTWHEATTTWRVAIGLPQGAAVPQIYVYCDKLSDAIQVAAGLQHHGCSTLPGDLVSTRSSLTGFHNAARRTLRSCGVAEVTVRNDGQYPGLVQVTRH